MSLFCCSQCGCVENTALADYHIQEHDHLGGEPFKPLCSECNPGIREWHGKFEKRSAVGMWVDKQGFLHNPDAHFADRDLDNMVGIKTETGIKIHPTDFFWVEFLYKNKELKETGF